jgi:hypothetical protein
VFNNFQNYKAFAENLTNHKIKTLHSNNRGEFKSHQFNIFCAQHGIACQFTIPYMPKQKFGVSECKNYRTLMELAQCMLHTSNLPNSFWADVVATTRYIQTQSFSKTTEVSKTTLILWCGKTPNLSHLHIFGYSAYVHILNEQSHKLNMKPHKCTFVGYGELQGVKSYHLYGRDRRKYLISRNMTFDKEILLNSKEIEHDDTLHLTNTIDNQHFV